MKLTWVDQQIEKLIEREKQEEEMKKIIQERGRLIEERRLEQVDNKENAKRDKQLMSNIEQQIRHFKLKDGETDSLKREEGAVMKKKHNIEDLLRKNQEDLQQRETQEIALDNINEFTVKLRTKAGEIEDQLKKERKLVEKILASQATEKIQNESKRAQVKHSIRSFLHYIREQQIVESNRQDYFSFVFDSEAKEIWEKQDKQWKEEQQIRDKLLQDVLEGIQCEIEENLTNNLEKQQDLLDEREKMLQMIGDQDKSMKRTVRHMHQKNIERKLELNQQLSEIEHERKLEENRKKGEELDNIKKKEEPFKHELMRMQTKPHPKTRFHMRLLW